MIHNRYKYAAYTRIALLLLLITGALADADEIYNREYKIKAAYIYNFIKVVEWPEDIVKIKIKNKKPFMVAVVGRDPFGANLDPIEEQLIHGVPIDIKRVLGPGQNSDIKLDFETGKFHAYAGLKDFDLVFICSSEKKHAKHILKSFDQHGVLTIGDYEGFLEDGGVVNLITQENKCLFEINLDQADSSGLEINLKTLRLAKRIIKSKDSGAEQKKVGR